MWRTGSFAFDKTVHKGLGLGEHDAIVGFLYLGQPGGRLKRLPERDPADFVNAGLSMTREIVAHRVCHYQGKGRAMISARSSNGWTRPSRCRPLGAG